jgi:hypothetical protein
MWVSEHASETTNRVVYRMDISGPQLGPEISGDFPQVLAALVALAEQRRDA